VLLLQQGRSSYTGVYWLLFIIVFYHTLLVENRSDEVVIST